MRVDLNAFLGAWPFRAAAGARGLDLLGGMDRAGIERAWVSNAASIGSQDVGAGNRELYRVTETAPRLLPVPSASPAEPAWGGVLREATERGAPAVRCDPTYLGVEPAGAAMRGLARACGAAGLPLLLAVRVEDIRQRVPEDTAPELQPWQLRALVRSDPLLRLIVTHADRDFIEQVHFGSTPEEASRILWDICWLWGPPEDHLALLLRSVGVNRFAFGTGMPFRLPEAAVAKLDLLDLEPEDRAAIESGNAAAFSAASRRAVP